MRKAMIAIALIGASLFANWSLASDEEGRVFAWLITGGAMIALVADIGWALNNRPAGVLIDNRNRISLSKLQATSWTVLVLSGLTTLVAAKLEGVAAVRDPITIDGYLLAAMGISATSLVATPAILSLKTAPDGSSAVFGRAEPTQARWVDVFRGDDIANADSPDLSKIQQFLISLVVIGAYAFLLGKALYLGEAPEGQPNGLRMLELPRLGQDMLWLLGISHAGYLSYKAVPHTEGKDQPADDDTDPRQSAAG